jgi:hypothetical protein
MPLPTTAERYSRVRVVGTITLAAIRKENVYLFVSPFARAHAQYFQSMHRATDYHGFHLLATMLPWYIY